MGINMKLNQYIIAISLFATLIYPTFSQAQNKAENNNNEHHSVDDKSLASGAYYKHLMTLRDVIVPKDCIEKRLDTPECKQSRETFQKISQALRELPQDKWQMAVNGYVNKFRREKEDSKKE